MTLDALLVALPGLALLVLLVGLAYRLTRRSLCLFVVQFRGHQLVVKKGTLPTDFKAFCENLARHSHVKGTLYGYRHHGQISLQFSSNFPPLTKEKLRSAFPFQSYQRKRS